MSYTSTAQFRALKNLLPVREFVEKSRFTHLALEKILDHDSMMMMMSLCKQAKQFFNLQNCSKRPATNFLIIRQEKPKKLFFRSLKKSATLRCRVARATSQRNFLARNSRNLVNSRPLCVL